MIIQRLDSDLLLITQVDHAALAGRIMTAWRADGFPQRPTHARVLEATSQHDLGWQIVDAAPTVSSETETPHAFLDAPLAVRQGVWPRAMDQLEPRDPYVAALVAQHALSVYRRFAPTPGWEEFFPGIERRRDELLATQGLDFDTFLHDYEIVGMGDLWSLVFCNGWHDPYSMGAYRAVLHRSPPAEKSDANTTPGGWLEITPDPFEGAQVPLNVVARRVPARRYSSDADQRHTIARAPVVHLTGVAGMR